MRRSSQTRWAREIPAALLGTTTRRHFLRGPPPLDSHDHEWQTARTQGDRDSGPCASGAATDQSRKIHNSVLARLDLNRGRLDLVAFGHTGMIHLCAKTGLCQIRRGDNLSASSPFLSSPETYYFFYSDGVIEARNTAGELFGLYLITTSVGEVRCYRDERGRSCVALAKFHNL